MSGNSSILFFYSRIFSSVRSFISDLLVQHDMYQTRNGIVLSNHAQIFQIGGFNWNGFRIGIICLANLHKQFQEQTTMMLHLDLMIVHIASSILVCLEEN